MMWQPTCHAKDIIFKKHQKLGATKFIQEGKPLTIKMGALSIDEHIKKPTASTRKQTTFLAHHEPVIFRILVAV